MVRASCDAFRIFTAIVSTCACFGLAGSPAWAADEPPPFSPEELEQIVAPIALYPDSLLAQVFMASTYPLEVVQAARFAKENPGLKDEALAEALKGHDWDASVESLVSFPQVLAMMDEKLDWTQKLGDAFLAQQKEVMAAVQRLRAKAKAEGNLESTNEQTVKVEPALSPEATGQQAPTQVTVQQPPTQVVVEQAAPPTVIVIEQTNPQVVYVPTYNPTVVYGVWPYPAYPPYYYYPPGYVMGASMVSFGVGMAVGAAVWGGDCDWDGGDVNINNSNNFNSERNNVEGGRGDGERGDRGDRGDRGQGGDRAKSGDRGGKQKWQHDPSHRKGAQYRDKGTQQKFDRSGPKGADSREAFRGRAEQGRQQIQREGPAATQRDADRAGARDQQRASSSRDRAGQQRPSGGGDRVASQDRAGSSRDRTSGQQRSGYSGGRGSGGRGSDGFQGMGRGSEVRRDSSRGQSSRASASRSSGGSRGGGRGGGGGGGRRR
jgi:hypothetical protein